MEKFNLHLNYEATVWDNVLAKVRQYGILYNRRFYNKFRIVSFEKYLEQVLDELMSLSEDNNIKEIKLNIEYEMKKCHKFNLFVIPFLVELTVQLQVFPKDANKYTAIETAFLIRDELDYDKVYKEHRVSSIKSHYEYVSHRIMQKIIEAIMKEWHMEVLNEE